MDEKGASLLESLLAVVILALIVFLLANIPNAVLLITKSRHISLAREIAVKQIEDKRSIQYSNLPTGSSAISDERLSQLPQGNGTVVVGVEVEPGLWANCDPNVCVNEQAIKQVEVTVDWVEGSKPQKVTLKTMIGEGGINQ